MSAKDDQQFVGQLRLHFLRNPQVGAVQHLKLRWLGGPKKDQLSCEIPELNRVIEGLIGKSVINGGFSSAMFAGDWLNPLGDFALGSQDAADSAGQTDAFSYKVRGEHFTKMLATERGNIPK